MKLPENSTCVDCDSQSKKKKILAGIFFSNNLFLDPEWASINLGVFICISCSGSHRNLGSHVSKVRSCILDIWEPETVEFMRNHGNAKANEYWEATIPKNFKKPTAKTGLYVFFFRFFFFGIFYEFS